MSSKSVVMFQAHWAHVNQYYHGGAWHSVPPNQDLEHPVISNFAPDPKGGKGFIGPGDTRCGGVYPEMTILMGYLHEEEVSFEELHEVAKALGYGESFHNEVTVFVGGKRPLRPAIHPDSFQHQLFNGQHDADWWSKWLREKGFEVWTTGNNGVVLEFGEDD